MRRMVGNKAEVELVPPIHIGYWYTVEMSKRQITRSRVIIIIPIQPNPHTWNCPEVDWKERRVDTEPCQKFSPLCYMSGQMFLLHPLSRVLPQRTDSPQQEPGYRLCRVEENCAELYFPSLMVT